MKLFSITISRSSLRLTSIKSVMPSSHLILCRPLLLLPPILPSIRVFSNESTLRLRWPKYWSFSFSISPSKEHPGLISLRMDWLDLLAGPGTLKNLLQHHSSKASILWCSDLNRCYLNKEVLEQKILVPSNTWHLGLRTLLKKPLAPTLNQCLGMKSIQKAGALWVPQMGIV